MKQVLSLLKKKRIIFLILILLLAAFLRLYRISDYMTFLGDEGRDVLIAKGILEGDFTLLGPRSSAGDFFMGPAYYYMITPFLWLSQLDPVGPAIMVALFSVATAFLIYIVGKKFFDTAAGLFAAGLYAVSPLVINYSHSSWNPNVLPFFALLLIYIIYCAKDAQKPWKYYLFGGFLLGIAMQLHYLSLFLAVIIAVYIFIFGWMKEKGIRIILLLKQYSQVLLGFFLGFSPFLAFEVRHGFPNTKSILEFIFGTNLQNDYTSNSSFFDIVKDVFFRIFARLIFDYPTPDRVIALPEFAVQMWAFLIMIVAISSVVLLFFRKNKYISLLLLLWLFLSVLFFGTYKKTIYDYLFTFLFPLPFLLVGNLFSVLFHTGKKKKQRILWMSTTLLLFICLIGFNLYGMPFKSAPNKQKDQVKKITEFVIAHTDNKPFNFALISGGNSDHAYRYYFEVLQHKPRVIENTVNDPKRKTVTNQLLVVCEDTWCKPLGHSLFEVAGFGRATVAGEWNVSVVKVFKLVPYKEKK